MSLWTRIVVPQWRPCPIKIKCTVSRRSGTSRVFHHCLLETYTHTRKKCDGRFSSSHGTHKPWQFHWRIMNSLVVSGFSGKPLREVLFPTLLGWQGLSTPASLVEAKTRDCVLYAGIGTYTWIWNSWREQKRKIPRVRCIGITPGESCIVQTCRETLHIHIRCRQITLIIDVWFRNIWCS